EDVGLSDFTILLHHAQTDRAEMYSKLSGLLQNNSSSHLMHDSLASEIVQVSRNIDYLIGELLGLTRPLHQEYFFSVDGEKRYGGITLHTLHALLPPQYRPELGIPPQISSSLSYPVLQNFLRLIPPIESLSKRFDYPNHPWFRRKSFGTLGLMDRDLLSRAIDDLLAILEN